ncbi:MAG: enoyl-CoA hydratase-related protein [Anaerolineae bacterium]
MAERSFVKTVVEDGVGLLTLDYPPMNLLNAETFRELHAALDELLSDEKVKATVITGGGEFVFIAGADIKAIVAIQSAEEARELVEQGQALVGRIEEAPVPFIAAINGHCLGGGLELAMACHLRVASNRAQLGQTEIALGIIPGFGGTQRLPRLVGRAKALELILTGDRISGSEAAAIGLVNRAVPAGEVLLTAMGMAKKIAGHGRMAIRAAVAAVQGGLERPLAEGLALEADEFALLAETYDMREGLSAFLEKRQPQFQDR